MTDNNIEKLELFEVLEKMKNLYPEMRFGQLVCNLSYWAKGVEVSSPWEVEDEELINAGIKHLSEKGII